MGGVMGVESTCERMGGWEGGRRDDEVGEDVWGCSHGCVRGCV